METQGRMVGKRGLKKMVLAFGLMCLMLEPNMAQAYRPVPPPPGFHHRPFPTPGLFPFGHVLPRLPPGFLTLSLAAGTFYFYAGNYFRPGPHGYVVIEAPVGAVIRTLPPGFTTVMIGGATYYTYAGVYYTLTPDGYVVVPRPAQPPAAAVATAEITTRVQSLNMRSGPGATFEVILTLPYGTVAKILESKSGWYFIELTDGTKGWVLAKFTAPAVALPQG